MGRKGAEEARLSLAIGAEEVVAVAGGGRVVVSPLALPAQGDASPALAEALANVATRLGEVGQGEGVAVDVALLPPLVDVRLVDLPPLAPDEAESVLQRSASRYFLGGTVARVIGVATPVHGPRRRERPGGSKVADPVSHAASQAGDDSGARPPVLAAAAPAALVEAVHRAVVGNGWRLNRIVPAHAAWLAAAGRADGAPGGNGASPNAVIAEYGGFAHVLRLAKGSPTLLRRVPAADTAEVVRAAGDSPGRAALVAGGDTLAALSGALTTAGWTSAVHGDAAGSDPAQAGRTGAVEAARFARFAEPELVPLSARLAMRDRNRRLALRLAAAAVALFIAAAAFELWSVHRDLARVRAARADIRAEVAPLVAIQDSISRMAERMAAIDAIGASAPHWTRALTDIAVLLPFDSHLTGFVASGDTLEIEAAGTRAGEALQALRGASSLTDVRLIGMVDRELDDGTTAVERFRIWARLVPEGARGAGPAAEDTGGSL
ncbi:MAG TPA: hypothetical protein VNZ57_15790 [Longimicrobiales bacterium]|nr:hypothetical protein [Longimicrobiales bacterium]